MIKLLLVLFVCGISFSDACSCPTLDVKTSYCNAVYVGVIEVRGEQGCGDGFTCYVIKQKQIKGDTMTLILLKTNDDSAGCGVNFKVGEKYLVASKYKNAVFSIFLDLCDLYENLTGLSDLEIASKTNEYSQIKC